jgi:hypothetical protein
MATIRGGAKICDSCGDDCTNLYGFVMEVRKDMMSNARVKSAADEIDDKFGQHDFTFCWACTAKAFGVKDKNEEEAEVKAETKTQVKAPKKK